MSKIKFIGKIFVFLCWPFVFYVFYGGECGKIAPKCLLKTFFELALELLVGLLKSTGPLLYNRFFVFFIWKSLLIKISHFLIEKHYSFLKVVILFERHARVPMASGHQCNASKLHPIFFFFGLFAKNTCI